MDKHLTLIHTDNYKHWVLSDTHPTQGRRFTNARNLMLDLAPAWGVVIEELEPTSPATPSELARVHDREYVDEVLQRHVCGEWEGANPGLADLASVMAGGTLKAAAQIAAGLATTVVHLPGAKHHAMRDHSSGFCVFNDFALAAFELTDLGHRVAILDFDAHRGDGTEALTARNPNVLTFSIHDESIFPWSPGADIPELHIYNRPLPARATGGSMLQEVENFIGIAKEFEPTVMFIAAGADGHISDPLSTLRYADSHFRFAARKLRRAFPQLPMLIGGAGGYRPDDATPRAWATFALTLAGGTPPRETRRPQPQRQYFSLAGQNLDDPEVVDRIARELWENFMTREGESWEKS